MRLPDFPWDHLVPFKEKAQSHPYGLVDLSVGTPVDATPAVVQHALAGAADSPGYPLTAGTPDLRDAAAGWLARRLGVLVDPGAVLPVLGTKELVAQLPGQLGLEPGDRVWVPTPAYPTYEVGALLARCEPVVGPTDGVTLVWLNSPGNPTGRVLSVEEMRAVVSWARERGVIVASDECYIELGWEARAVSVLHPDVCGGSHEGLLAVHSLSKRSNLAGYRAGFVTGDPELVHGLLQVRKHAGMMMPAPIQAAMIAALADDMHVADQRARYANRRAVLAAALAVAGFTIDHSEAGLYLWATRGEDCWATVDALAGVGLLVAPGSFYGESGRRHVRVALTAPDAQIATVPERMAMLPVAGTSVPTGPVPVRGHAPGGYGAAPAHAHTAPRPVSPSREQAWPPARPGGFEADEPARGGQRPVGSFDRYQSDRADLNARPGQDTRQAGQNRFGSGGPGNPAGPGDGGTGALPVPPYQTGQIPVPPYETGQIPVPPYQTGQSPVPQYQAGQNPVPGHQTGQTAVPAYPLPGPAHTGQLPLPPYPDGQQSPAQDGTGAPHSGRQPGGEGTDSRGAPGWSTEPDIR